MEEKKQEVENVLPVGKDQEPPTSTKGNDTKWHRGKELVNKIVKNVFIDIWLFFSGYWPWLKKHKYDLVSGFLVTVAAVFIAFWLTGLGEQKTLDRIILQKLELAYVENLYNGTAAKEILDTYADANSLGINVNRPNSTAALVAFQDSNVLQLLPIHKVSLLRSYVDSISTLNQSLLVHQGVLETQNYRRTTQEKEARQNVHKNAAAVFAMSFVLLEELKEYTDQQSPDWKNIKRLENRIKFIKGKALKGEVTLSKGLKGSQE